MYTVILLMRYRNWLPPLLIYKVSRKQRYTAVIVAADEIKELINEFGTYLITCSTQFFSAF